MLCFTAPAFAGFSNPLGLTTPAGRVRSGYFKELHMDNNDGSQGPEDEQPFGPVIYRYTRAEALDEGVLVDVSNPAAEAGFKVPVALTCAAWADCVEWNEEDSRRQTPQNESGRLWDVLWMATIAIARSRRHPQAQHPENQLHYQLVRVPRGGQATVPREVTLKLVSGSGDAGEHVITIMLPHED